MNTIILIIVIAIVYLILGCFIAASYSWSKNKYPDDRIPWMSYEFNTAMVLIFWIVFVICVPVAHGIWALSNWTIEK